MAFSHTPQHTTAVVMVDDAGLPGIFIQVEGTLGVNMAVAVFQSGFHFPDPVQFIAGMILIDVTCLDDVIVLQVARFQLVGVVRNVHFLLAHQFPVVAIRRTVVEVEVIRGTHTVGGRSRRIVGNGRCATNLTRASVVDPRLTRLFHLIQGFVHQQYVTGQTRWRQYILLEVEQHVVVFARIVVGQFFTEGKFLTELHQRVVAVGLRCYLTNRTLNATTTITDDMVPDGFQTVLRNREWRTHHVVLEAVTAVYQLGFTGVFNAGIVDGLWVSRRTMGWVHRHTVGIRVLLEHRLLAFGQLVGVLHVVFSSDHKQRCFVGKRVHQLAAFLVACWRGLQTAVPGRNITSGSFLRAHRGQFTAQLGGFSGRYGCVRCGPHQGQQQGATQGSNRCFQHSYILTRSPEPIRKSTSQTG